MTTLCALSRRLAVCAAAAAAALYMGLSGSIAHAAGDTAQLKLIPTGAMPKLGGYMPQRLQLTDQKPAAIKVAPTGLAAPLYGVLSIGPKEAPTKISVVVDEPDSGPMRLFVDSNGNGDLTDDPAPVWAQRPAADGSSPNLTPYLGGAMVDIHYGSQKMAVHLGIYKFPKADTRRAALKTTLLYYSDYAYEGEMKLGGKAYKVMLADSMATGDFRGTPGTNGSGVSLLIDVNGNGKFDARGERYDVSKPFNIGGTTYEIADLSPSGAAFSVVKSSQTVAEILPPPDLSAGHSAIAFKTKTTDGTAVAFPSSYKGKVVLLDFWATWCGPCLQEMPNVIAAYNKYHDRGFEILGISLDQKDAGPKLASFTKEKSMPWPQVYDGNFWKAEIAELYVVQSIPQAYLVDGSTGAIIAEGNSIRGEALAPAIEKALAARK